MNSLYEHKKNNVIIKIMKFDVKEVSTLVQIKTQISITSKYKRKKKSLYIESKRMAKID